MNEGTRVKLERLQEIVREQTGRRIPTEELLDQVIEQALESPRGVIDACSEPRVPVSEAEKAAFNAGRIVSGITTREADIDTIIYEGDGPGSTASRD